MSGNPAEGEISWYLNGQKITSVADGIYLTPTNSLIILHISAETIGNYTCLLDNGIAGSECESPYYQGMKIT